MKGINGYMNIDLIGEIFIIDEIIYYDKPLTFTCENNIGSLFVASCIDLDDNEQWLFLPVSGARLIQIIRGSITAYEAFKKSEMGFIWKVTMQASDYRNGKAERISLNKLDDDDLPDKDIVFDIDGEETFSIKSSERKGIVEQSVKERREIFDLSLELQESHTHEIEAAFLGKVLEETQNTVNIIAHNKGINAKVPKQIRETNKLIYTGNFAASFGIRLKSQNLADIFNESDLQENLTVFMNLLEAKSDAEEITKILKELNPAVIYHYKNFLKLFKRENVSVKTHCAFPNKKYKDIKLTSEEIAQSLKVLESEIKEVIKEDIFDGKIVAIDTTKSKFKFISDDNETISGVIDKSVNTDEYRLPKEAKVKLKIRTKVNDFTGLEHTKYELLKLDYQ